jgi:hypothetical protein
VLPPWQVERPHPTLAGLPVRRQHWAFEEPSRAAEVLRDRSKRDRVCEVAISEPVGDGNRAPGARGQTYFQRISTAVATLRPYEGRCAWQTGRQGLADTGYP